MTAEPADHDPGNASRDGLVEAVMAVRSARGGVRLDDGTVLCVTDLAGLPQAWALDPDGGWPWRVAAGERVVELLAVPGAGPRGAKVVGAVDAGGDERTQIHRLDLPAAGATPLTRRPDAVHALGVPTGDRTGLLVTATVRNGVDFDLWQVPLTGGEPALVAELGGWNRVVDVLEDGRAVVVHATSLMVTDVALVDVDRGEVTERIGDDVAARHLPGGHLADGRLLLRSDRDGDVLRAGTWDGGWQPVTGGDADCDGLSGRDGLVALTLNDGGTSRLRLGPADALDHTVGVPLPVGVASDVHVPPGGQGCLLTFSGPRHAPNVWWASTSQRPAPLTRAPAPALDLRRQPEPELCHVTADDGLSVPMWLTRPSGAERPPVVVWLHGGPESQARPEFDPRRALLVAAGYAVAQPNVRGSTGYGRAYAALDDRERRGDAIADVVAVGDWLADRADLDGQRLAVGGGSYGGYLTLCALVAAPHRWAAGIDVVGIANLVTFLERTSDYRRALREAEYGSLDHDRALLADLSPLHRVEQIAAPLLVVHGRNDPRVPLGEAEQIVAALRERDRPVELVVFDDEGHGVNRDHNRRELLRRMLAFLDQHLVTS